MIRRGAAFLCFLIRRLFLSPATRPPRTPVAAPKDKTHKKSHTHPRGALLMANTAPRPPPGPFSGLFCPPQAPSGRRESSVPDEPARKPQRGAGLFAGQKATAATTCTTQPAPGGIRWPFRSCFHLIPKQTNRSPPCVFHPFLQISGVAPRCVATHGSGGRQPGPPPKLQPPHDGSAGADGGATPPPNTQLSWRLPSPGKALRGPQKSPSGAGARLRALRPRGKGTVQPDRRPPRQDTRPLQQQQQPGSACF